MKKKKRSATTDIVLIFQLYGTNTGSGPSSERCASSAGDPSGSLPRSFRWYAAAWRTLELCQLPAGCLELRWGNPPPRSRPSSERPTPRYLAPNSTPPDVHWNIKLKLVVIMNWSICQHSMKNCTKVHFLKQFLPKSVKNRLLPLHKKKALLRQHWKLKLPHWIKV